MLRNDCIIACVAFALFVTGCGNPPASAPVAGTREADIQSVREVESAYLKAFAAKDAEKYFSYFADDATGLYPGASMLDGRQAVRNWVEPMFADPNLSWKMQSSRIEASEGGNMIYSMGTYIMTITDTSTKKVRTEKGKYLTIFRKQTDGSWKVAVDSAVADPAI
jgi:uncharacterized protein (TIGR02246 family)